MTRQPPTGRSAGGGRVCVYGITTSARMPPLPGMRGERLGVLRAGRLSAIVAPARQAPASTVANLRRYHEAVARLADALPDILPVRFGTVLDDAELGFILRARSGALTGALKQVRGRVQVTLRVAAIPSDTGTGSRTGAPSRTPPSATARRASPGIAYLRGRAEAVARARDVPGFAPVRAAVARWVHGERIMKHGGVTSIYHLVKAGAVPAYVRALSAAARSAGIVVAVSGPFPPYAFTDAALM